MSQTATNPQTGERFVLVGGQWVPMTQTATNPETGERFGLAGNQWVPIERASPAPTPTPAPAPVAAPPKERPGFLDYLQSNTTDYITRTLKGALGGVEMGTNLFGADNPVSEILRGAQEGINEYLVSDTAKQAAEERSKRLEGKGFFGTLAEVPGIVADDPALLAEVLGTALPSIGAAALTGGSSVGVQGAAMLGTGAAMGAGAIKGSIYATTKEELLKTGRFTEEEAERAASEAQSYAGENLDMIALGTALGAIASRTGMEPTAARLLAGRIVGKSVGQTAGREALETALLQGAQKGAVRTATEEAVLEGAQGAQEKFATNLALQRQGMDVDLMEGVGSAAALEGTLGGALGGGFGLAGRQTGTPEATALAADPVIRAEFQRLAAQEVAMVMQADPEISQNDAVAQVSERAEELLTRAAANVVGAEGEADVAADVDTAMDVSGGGGAGAAPDLGAAPPVAGAPDLGEAVAGRLGEPLPSVPVPDVGAGAGVAPLAPVAPAFDIAPIMEAPTLKERTSAARQIVSDIAIAMPELQALPKGKYNQAATQMAKSAARGEQFDPVDVVYSVAGIERPAPVAPAPTPVPAPEVPAAPSVDEVAVAPVKAAIEAATTPAPPAPGAVPSLALTSAREVGITPVVAAPEVGITPEVAAPPAPPATRTMNDLAGIGTVNPENTNEVLVEGGGVQLTPVGEDIVQLDSLRAVEKGGGRKAMEQLVKVADENGTTIQLSPEPFAAPAGKEMTPTELSDWYAGFGFEAQPDGTMVRTAAPPPSATITPAPAPTSQQIVEQIDQFARSEAEDRGFDPDMFTEGARDAARGAEPLSDDVILEGQGPDALDAYKAGIQFGRDRVADMQAAPAAPAAPAEVAMEAAPEGGTEPLTDANVDAAVSVKLTKAQIKRLEQAAGIQRMKLSGMQKRIARSRSAEETMSLAGRLMLAVRKPGESVGILTSLFNSTPPPILQALMAPLETADVVRLGERAGMENVTLIDNMMRDEYIPYVNRIMERASKLAERWADFTSRSPEGADAMGDVMYFSNMIDADPSLAPTAAEYLKIDQEFQATSAKLAAEADPKKKSTLKGQLTRRRGEIQRLYFGATDPDGAKIAGWNDVPSTGKQLFREARDYYRADFQEHYRLLMQRIDDAQFEEEDAARLKAAVDDMFKEAAKRVIYFPMKRFGDYWVSVGKGKSGEFHMFESASAQDAFVARLRREGETREIDFSKGRDTLRLGLRNQTADASSALKGILDLIDGGGISDVDLLKDHVFQMYLTALPEADMRRRFIHRQFKTGFSTDALRTFATTAIASANQLGRLAYNYKFNNLIDQSYAETSGNPAKRRLDTITRELEMRIGTTMSPEPGGIWDQAASLGAKATFLFILSSPKSAIMNLTQLHIVGLPTLSAEFGEKATYAMAARYTGQILTGKRIANPFRDEEGNIRLQLPEFTTEGSAYINGLRETDPDRYEAIQKAWEYAQEREVTESTFSSAANVYERSNEPTAEMSFTQAVREGNAALAVQRATANAVNGMGALFHHTERMGREIMYMSAFELAYDRALAEGKSSAEATEIALPKAAEMTNKGMFDFSNWNKSRAAKTPVGKVALQMRSYSIAMTSLLFRSFTNMVALNRTKAERLAAARVFMGVGAMTTLYGGFRASQFYLMGMLGFGLYEMLKSAIGDEDDEEQEIEQGYLNPETIDRELMRYADEQGRELTKKDWDYYIRTVWIPETLGKGGTLQEALGISDETADKLATASDIGIPGIFGVDISNSVSLTNLWHPIDVKSDKPEVQLFEMAGRGLLGPSGSLLTAPVKFYTEQNAGNFDKAIESIMPAFLRGYVKSQRLQEEGLRVGKNQDVILRDPSFYDTYTLAMQSLGFPEAETSRAMQLDIRAGEIEREIADEKTNLLDQRYRALNATATDTSGEAERALREVERAIEIYNLNYPSNAIDEDTKERSFQQKSMEAAERMYGLGMNPNIPIRQPLMEERVKELGQ